MPHMFAPEKLIKIAFAIFLALLVMLQFFSFPGQFRYMAQQEPENAFMRWPLTALVFLLIAAVQICIICLWKLLDNLFAAGAIKNRIKYVNISISALSFVWLVIAAVLLLLLKNADDPGLPVVITVIECALTVVVLLYLNYRKLLLNKS